jgi:hypothetical protein
MSTPAQQAAQLAKVINYLIEAIRERGSLQSRDSYSYHLTLGLTDEESRQRDIEEDRLIAPKLEAVRRAMHKYSNEFDSLAKGLALAASENGIDWTPIMSIVASGDGTGDYSAAYQPAIHLQAILAKKEERPATADLGTPIHDLILKILSKLKPGHGLTAKEILQRFPKYPPKPAESTLRKHYLQPMIKAGEIANRRGVGYFIPATRRD